MKSSLDYIFPFVAMIGQEKAQKALTLALINPRIGSVLLSGQSGTAKSTIVRSLASVVDHQNILTMPLNITEAQAIGGLHVESVTFCGVKQVEQGLLSRAHKQILYIDEINLLSTDILNYTVDAFESKQVEVAREGVHGLFPTDFQLFATMNPDEGQLSPKVLDRFGLSVRMNDIQDITLRKQIIRDRLLFDKNPEAFIKTYQTETTNLMEKIKQSSRQLINVQIPEEIRKKAIQVVLEAHCDGHRADHVLLETAKACAAYDGQERVGMTHLQTAAEFVLPHRLKESRQEEIENENHRSPEQSDNPEETEKNENQSDKKEENKAMQQNFESNHLPDDYTEPEGLTELPEQVDAAVGTIDLSLIEPIFKSKKTSPEGSGKRQLVRKNYLQGRHVKSIPKSVENADLSLSATIRAAAPHQLFRDKGHKAIAIHSSDIHIKVKEKRTGHMILFLIDASGSMGANKRMQTVKSAILSLLEEAYVKRDKVGFISFRNNEAEVLLEPTRSIVHADMQLQALPTGGNTPLKQGLKKTLQKLKQYQLKDSEYQPFLVLITDGRSNEAGDRRENWTEVLNYCHEIRQLDVNSMAIDTETGPVQLKMTEELANHLDSAYYKMPSLEKDSIVNLIQQELK